jgi:hypothetical protein
MSILIEKDYQECLSLLVFPDGSDFYGSSEERFRDASFYCAEDPFPIYRGRTRSLLGALAHALDAHMFEIAVREGRQGRGDSLSEFVGMYFGNAVKVDEEGKADQSWRDLRIRFGQC